MYSEGIDATAVVISTPGSLPTGRLADFWNEIREVTIGIRPESVHV